MEIANNFTSTQSGTKDVNVGVQRFVFDDILRSIGESGMGWLGIYACIDAFKGAYVESSDPPMIHRLFNFIFFRSSFLSLTPVMYYLIAFLVCLALFLIGTIIKKIDFKNFVKITDKYNATISFTKIPSDVYESLHSCLYETGRGIVYFGVTVVATTSFLAILAEITGFNALTYCGSYFWNTVLFIFIYESSIFLNESYNPTYHSHEDETPIQKFLRWKKTKYILTVLQVKTYMYLDYLYLGVLVVVCVIGGIVHRDLPIQYAIPIFMLSVVESFIVNMRRLYYLNYIDIYDSEKNIL